MEEKQEEDSVDDISDMIHHSRKDMGDMLENLKKLRNLQKDDKTEAALLRSRIDEQAQLIGILKQRADESMLTVRTLERINQELEEYKKSTDSELASAQRKYNMLDQRFNDLASNHQQLIQIKDEYKRVNEELRRENYRLRNDNENLFSQAIVEKEQMLSEMDKKIISLKEQNNMAEMRYRELQSSAAKKEENSALEIKDLKKKIAEVEERLKGATAKLLAESQNKQTSEAELQTKVKTLTKEKEDMMNLAVSRGKAIQEKVTENKKLEQKVQQMEKLLRDMEDKFEREAEAVNASLQVRRLREQLSHTEQKYDQLTKDYDAFKKHSNQLVKKEKDLNERLKQLVQ